MNKQIDAQTFAELQGFSVVNKKALMMMYKGQQMTFKQWCTKVEGKFVLNKTKIEELATDIAEEAK